MRCSLRTAGPVSPGGRPRSDGAREAVSLDAAAAEGTRTAAANTETSRNTRSFGERYVGMSGVGMASGEGKASRGRRRWTGAEAQECAAPLVSARFLTLAEECAPVAGGGKSRSSDPDSNLPGSPASSAPADQV